MPLETYGVTAAGYRAPRGAELLALLRGAIDAAVGQPLGYEPDTLEGAITAAVAAVVGDLSEGDVQALADALDVNNAEGQLLANICALFGLAKSPATASRAVLTPTLSAPSVFVPAGTRFTSQPPGGEYRVWFALEDTMLSAPGDTILVACEDVGPVAAEPATIVNVLDALPGLTAVTNALAAAPGSAEQSDQALRLDRLALLQAGAKGPLGAIYAAAVRALPPGFYVGAVENTGDVAVLIDATPIAAHGHAIVVYPEPTAAEADALRLAILQSRPAGGPTSGDQTAPTFDPETGRTVTLGFYVAQQQPVGVQVSVEGVEPGFLTAEVEANVNAAVRAYFTGLRVGDDVRLLNLYRVLAGVQGLTAALLQLDNDGLGYAPADVPIGEFHIATVSEVVFL